MLFRYMVIVLSLVAGMTMANALVTSHIDASTYAMAQQGAHDDTHDNAAIHFMSGTMDAEVESLGSSSLPLHLYRVAKNLHSSSDASLVRGALSLALVGSSHYNYHSLSFSRPCDYYVYALRMILI